MNIEELDLSYSGLASLIDDDKIKGFQVLETIVIAIEAQQKTVLDREAMLQESKRVLNSLKAGAENCIRWVKAERPINLLIDKTVFALYETNEVKQFSLTNK